MLLLKLLYPFLSYDVAILENNHPNNIKPLFTLQKRSIWIFTFSKFDDQSGPLFRQTSILKLFDLVTYQVSIFMYKFYNKLLPAVFDDYFISSSHASSQL